MIRAGQRVMVIGPSGCGKTRWEMGLLEGVQSAVIFDAPQDPSEWLSWGPAHGYLVTDDVDQVRRHPRVVLQVDDLWLSDRKGWEGPGEGRGLGWQWTLACMAVWERGDTTVVFGEGLQLLPSSGANPYARRIITQGRKRRITSLTDVQVANWSDTLMVRQSDHCICFRVTAADIRILRDRGADPRPLLQLPDFGWGHHAQGARAWALYDPIPAARVWGGPREPLRPPPRPRRRPPGGARQTTVSPDPQGAPQPV